MGWRRFFSRWWPGAIAVAAVCLAGWQGAIALGAQDPATAFAQGFQAYEQGDLTRALPALSAASKSSNLGDYALYYLGQAHLSQHDLAAARTSLARLLARFPESLFRSAANLELGRIALRDKRPSAARMRALRVLSLSEQPALLASARLVLGRALIALNRPAEAYADLQQLRRSYPRSEADADARKAAASLLKSHPELAAVHSLTYLSREARLLIRERQAAQARQKARAALLLKPIPATKAAMLWVVARSFSAQAAEEEGALKAYLAAAARGPKAPRALYLLALLSWHRKDTAAARRYFRRVVARFHSSPLAPEAMLRIGRTYEDDGRLEAARDAYLRLAALYPDSKAGQYALFRAAWMLYTQKKFAAAANEFGKLKAMAAPATRAMYSYWQARSLEKIGRVDRARGLMVALAASTVSNYYPELARRRLHAPDIVLPPAPFSAPSTLPIDANVRWRFHLARADMLRDLKLYGFAGRELRYLDGLAGDTSHTNRVRLFLLGKFRAADDYYDAVVLASRLARAGALSDAVAERVRYPRAYWPLIDAAATTLKLDPNLLLALTRQESLFNPTAVSVADARGLMQLLPSTAQTVAKSIGMDFKLADLYDPPLNIRLGSNKLRQLIDLYHGDLFKAVAAYNAGEHAVQRWKALFPGPDDQWVENIEYNETRNYVKQVIGGMREYRMLYPANHRS